ncbi:hypothetical protein ACNKHX_15645 [Shigella flexneri]
MSLMLGRDHADIAPVAPQEIVDQAVLEVRALRHKPSWRISALRYVAAKCLALLACWGQGQ